MNIIEQLAISNSGHKYKDLVKASEHLSNIKPSHNEPSRIKEGWQIGMFEKEITHYSGQGACIRVFADTPAEAEALAAIVCACIKDKIA